MLSLLLFASMELLPLSQALSGAVSRASLNALFIGAGVLMSICALWIATNPAFNQLEDATPNAAEVDG